MIPPNATLMLPLAYILTAGAVALLRVDHLLTDMLAALLLMGAMGAVALIVHTVVMSQWDDASDSE